MVSLQEIWKVQKLIEKLKKTANCLTEWQDDRRGLGFLLILSLVIKGAIVIAVGVVNVDGVIYLSAAQEFAKANFQQGLELSYAPMPFFPLLIAACHCIIPDWVLAGQIVSLLALVGVVIPLYLTTKIMFDARTAFWAGLAFCLSPMISGYAADVYRDPIFLFFFAWSAFFVVYALTEKRPSFFVFASISTIFAFLCRVEAVSIPFGLLLSFVVLVVWKREEWRCCLQGGVLFLVIPAILAGLLWWKVGTEFVSYNRLQEVVSRASHFLTLDKYQHIYSQLSEMEKTVPGWKVHSHGFAETTRHYLWLVYLVGLLDIIGKLLFPVFLIPLYLGLRQVRSLNRGKVFSLLLLGGYFLGNYHFYLQNNYMEKRYLLPIVYLLFPWVGAGLSSLFQQMRQPCWRKMGLAFFFAFFCVVPFAESIDQVEAKDDTVKVAGEWLASQQDFSKTAMMFSGLRTSFYAGRGPNYFPASLLYIEDAAIENNVGFLIIEATHKGKKTIPEFKHFDLLKEFGGKKDIALIYRRKYHESS